MDSPEVISIDCGNGRMVRLASLPALTKPKLSEWAAEIGLDTPDFSNMEVDVIVRTLMTLFLENWERLSGPKVLLGHWAISSCVTSTGQTLLGSDISIGLDDIALCRANAVMVGHIHKVQQWSINDGATLVSYCGSSHPCNWGETDEKSFSVWTFDEATGQVIDLVRVPFPHRPMVKVDIVFTGEQKNGEWEWHYADEEQFSVPFGAELKVCYSVPKAIAAQVDDMYVRLIFAKGGIEIAAIERKTLATERDQIDGIALKESTRSQYIAACEAKKEEPRPGALELADQMDTEGVGR